jgi:hypothetical protein
VAEAQMRDLHDCRHPVHHNDFVAPVELVGLARRKAQRNVSFSRCAGALLPPCDRVTPDRRVAPFVAKSA